MRTWSTGPSSPPELAAEIRHAVAAILARIGPVEAGRLSLLDDTAALVTWIDDPSAT